ncbi:MAG: quinate/shikimate dehydrogenase, partial [Lachnospiraceae bacterium]|nr:quinate/shikimate dehydrogenase [Lachnospiraceae bacterium]
LKMAKAAGCKTANGKLMLLYQGAAAFKIWTGKDMPVEKIKKELFSD